MESKEFAELVLRNFPDVEVTKPLRFHYKELHYDLIGLIREFKELSNLSKSPETSRAIRFALEKLIPALEHDITYHISHILMLTGEIVSNNFLVKEGTKLLDLELDVDSESEDYSEDVLLSEELKDKLLTELLDSLRECVSQLEMALSEIDQVALSEFGDKQLEHLQDTLKEVSELIVNTLYSSVLELHCKARKLHRYSYPEEAKSEDRYEIIAIPLREKYHFAASNLNACPNCGANLTFYDRTFNGSYCETCRTLWIQLFGRNNRIVRKEMKYILVVILILLVLGSIAAWNFNFVQYIIKR